MCCRCGEHPARSAEEPFCPICVISIKVEVARGLTQLAGYLGAWAAFGDWCNSRQTPSQSASAQPVVPRSSRGADRA